MEALATFGPYTILRAIAQGRDSVSFAARFEGKTDRAYILALKVLRESLFRDRDFDDALLEELRMSVRLNHVNVAQTFDAGRVGDHRYIALEFVDGVPLALLGKAVDPGQRAVTTEVAAFICAEACAGLAYAHGRRDERGKVLGIAHSRVTPRTVLLSKSGLVKVVDFGLSAALTAARVPFDEDDDRHYIAPEVQRGEEYDRRADIFSVGALAYHLLTGRRIYEGETGDALEEKGRRGYVPAIRDIDGDVPEALAELVDTALASDPEKRFDDATQLRSGLAAWLRRNSPGFGRHRLKTYLNRLLPAATYGLLPDDDWETLHRKHFKALDPDSIVHDKVESDPSVPATKDAIAALMDDPDIPTLGQIDVSRMTTGAHPTVRDRATALAASRTPRPMNRGAAATSASKKAPPPMPGAGTTRSLVPSVPVITQPEVFASKQADEPEKPSVLDAPPTPTSAESQAPAAAPETPRPVASSSADLEDDGSPHVEIPADVDEPAGIEIDPTMVYDDSIDYGEQVSAVAEADALTRPPRAWGNIIGVVLGLALLGGLAYGGKWYVDQQAAIAGATTTAAPAVFITSRPQGATVLFDGDDSGLTTPVTLTELPAAATSVSVVLAGFDAPEARTLDPAAPAPQIRFDMEPSAHRIRIDSDPQGAEVIHEGDVVGVTPYVLGPVRRDYRQGVDLMLRLDGYFDEHVSIDWAPGANESNVRRPLRVDPDYVPPEPDAEEPS